MTLRGLAVPLLLLCSSCLAPEAPSDLLIACEVDTDCPKRYVCSKVAGRCYPSDLIDKAPTLVGNPIILPRLARAGVTLTVALAVNEELLSDPVVRLNGLRLAVDETGTDRAKLQYRFAYRVEGTEPENQKVPVTVDLVDLAGTTAAGLPGGDAQFDFTPPPAPDVAAPGKVLYHRVPWGADATTGAKRFWVEAAAGATEPGAEVHAYDDSAVATAADLGTAIATPDGSFELELMRADRPVIWLAALDAAGNRSAVVDVKDVSWTATLAGKVAGREFENPHDYELRPWFQRRFLQANSQDLGDTGPVSARGAGTQAVEGDTTTGGWMRRSLGELFARRSGHAVAFDSRRGRMVLFGGAGWGDTWEWDGGAWTRRTPLDPERDGNPSTRSSHAMAYDRDRDRVVLFGGQDSNGKPLGDTWEWDGASWARRAPTGAVPEPRFEHQLARDPTRGRVVLFGGASLDSQGFTVFLNDQWEWDGASWTQVTPAVRPAARSGHGMALDVARGKLVVFGGKVVDPTGSYTVSKDTWEWDGTTWQRIPAASPPSARTGQGMVYMPQVGVVLFGGDDDAGHLSDETWVWDGTDWTKLSPSHHPGQRSLAALAYDSLRNRVVACAGKGPKDNLGDTWELDGEDWTERSGDTLVGLAPSPRTWQAMAFDESRGRAVLFGGVAGGATGTYLEDTWEWDGSSWQERTPASGEPNPDRRASHAMAYDRARQRVVLFGGVNDAQPLADTWEWDGERWKERTRVATADGPSARYGHAMAFDDSDGETVLFGGTNLRGWSSFDDTWQWDGTIWRPAQVTGSPPSGRSYHALAYDSLRSRVVLYGGQAFTDAAWMCPPCGFPWAANDTYEWDGARWKYVVPAGDSAPPALIAHAMVFSQRGPVLMFGGGSWLYGTSPIDETWAWDGASWSRPQLGDDDDGSPPARSGHGLVYDSRRHRAVLFGGQALDESDLGDTWEWDDGAGSQPGQVARFAFAAAQAEPKATITQVTANWDAGGQGENGSSSVAGVISWVWDRGSFMPATSSSFGSGAPGRLSWSTSDPLQTARLLNGPRQEIVVGVTPQGANGTQIAQVVVDYVELVVQYRRP
jgi:hypothetical protein